MPTKFTRTHFRAYPITVALRCLLVDDYDERASDRARARARDIRPILFCNAATAHTASA